MRTQIRSLSLKPGESEQYCKELIGGVGTDDCWRYTIKADSSYRPVSFQDSLRKNDSGGFSFNDLALNQLYPNNYAKPYLARIQMAGCRSLTEASPHIEVRFNNTLCFDQIYTSQDTVVKAQDSTNAAITDNVRPPITILLARYSDNCTSESYSCDLMWGNITLFYHCPECKANKNSGVINATVSDDCVFSGDKVTFNCDIKSGATFLGWYDTNGNKVSSTQAFTITAESADLIFEARATLPQEREIVINYNNQTIHTFTRNDAIAITYKNKIIGILTPGHVCSILCAGKILEEPIYIDNYKLLCSDLVAETNIDIIYE